MDSQGNLWIATWNTGLFKIDFELKKLIHFEFPGANSYSSNLSCRYIYEDRKNQIWVGTRTGLLKHVKEDDSFISYQHNPDDPTSMSENTSFCIYEDSLGYIWSGSYGGGLNRLDQSTGKFRHFTTHDGLLNNNIFSLLPDNAGNLWIVSYDGVTRFNPYTFKLDNFRHENGLGSTSYDAFMYGKSPYTGDLYFGGRQGIDIIRPDSIRLSDYKPPVVFTDFQLFNESVPIKKLPKKTDSEFYLNQHISWTKEVTLNDNQRVFTFQYAALDFSGPENIQYAYQLAGFDSDWQYAENKRTATYTNLDPGKYIFKVKATNADRVWNEDYTSLALIITPPWWATSWAYLIYIVFIAATLFGIYHYQRRRWALQTALQLQRQEASRLKDLDAIKTNLYTNITHEFRTPLTVISGMVDLIRNRPKEWLIKGTELIEEHTGKLLAMVNQMLDLQKLEAGKMELNLIRADIISFINYIIEPFQFQAKSRGLELTAVHQSERLMMDFDPEKLGQVLSNLLSNAIKYTRKGSIVLTTRKSNNQHLEIAIQDTGIGIPEDKLPYIFDRFYQTEPGSTRRGEGVGIGLALVKELLAIMRGHISVSSEVGKGSTFHINLAITDEAEIVSKPESNMVFAPMPRPIEIDEQFSPAQKELEHILIIEDHPDVRLYLKTLLLDSYAISQAIDGPDGLKKSIDQIPDLIICDIMMPGKDGYQVCDELHQNALTSHIPIILLTAKADSASKIEGFQHGAEAYLSKPFRPEELKGQISMLLKQRKRLQEKFRDNFKDLGHSYPKDPYLEDLQKLILSELSNEALGIQEICKRIHVSRSQLHNKIKATTGYSTTIFIRKIRLKEARRLLKSTHLNISEIAYKTGFQDPNFFSRVYKREFGESPSEGRVQ
jgi:signal transduction histidine kinase/DNA-binding response OmpR family regulator